MKTIILALLLFAWTAPALAITAEDTYSKLAQVVAIINQDDTEGLEAAMEQAKQAVKEYASAPATAKFGYKDPLVPEFRQASVGLSIIAKTVIKNGNIERARKDAQETLDELRARMR